MHDRMARRASIDGITVTIGNGAGVENRLPVPDTQVSAAGCGQ